MNRLNKTNSDFPSISEGSVFFLNYTTMGQAKDSLTTLTKKLDLSVDLGISFTGLIL